MNLLTGSILDTEFIITHQYGQITYFVTRAGENDTDLDFLSA